ncbi:MAG: SCP2 sterol-binding domain-containing protein, partial [Sandaracinaceae bacterium]|nr:SCP2 sterol-binding domain-containing protein [Sandaracinaceae bacterium]
DGGKKGGAVVITSFESRDESGEVLFKNELSTFVKGAGGWGGDRGPDEKNLNASPDRAPDKSVEQKIHANQALLYRLSGDWNPLHADPSFAKAFGFEKPILHGLCTFGYAVRHVISSFAPKGDPRFFKSVKVRFAEPVLPGETIVTEMWKDSASPGGSATGDTKILFRVKSKDRDKVVISNAAIELYAEIPKPKAKPAQPAASAGAGPVVPNSSDVFAGISAFLGKNAGTGDKIKTVFQFKLKNPDATWTIDLASGDGKVAQGETAAPGCTLEITDADFMDMCTGKADAMKLFTGGKLKITGNIMASQKLDFLKKVDPNDVMAAAQKRSGGAASTGAATGAGAGTSVEPTSADVFGGIAKYLAKSGGQGDKIKTVFQFKLKNPDATWTIDLASGDGKVGQGETAPPGCTLEITDADFMDMCTGKADAMKLFTGGKLKITGNIMASQKLDFLKKVDPNDVMAAAQKRSGGAASTSAATGAGAGASVEPTSADVFGGIAKYLAKSGGQGDKIKTVFQFKLKNPDATWTIDLASGDGKVGQGETAPPGCTLEITDADFMDMCTGKADAMKLFTGGKLKITGNIMASQKLDFLKKVDPNDVLAAMKERGGGGGSVAAAAPAAASAEPTSTDVFGGIARYLAKNGGQGDKIKTVFQFKLKGPDATWTIDLASGDGKVGQGETAPPGCTLEIADADFMDMCTGKADAMKLFTGGKLKITGNIMASQKLDFLRKVDPSDVLAAMKERTGAGGGGAAPKAAAPAAASSGASSAGKAKDIAKKIGDRIAANANLASEVGALIELRVKDPEATFSIDLKSGPGGVKDGKADKPDVVLTVADADLAALTSGGSSLKSLYQHGKVRVDGDAHVVRKLAFLEKIG